MSRALVVLLSATALVWLSSCQAQAPQPTAVATPAPAVSPKPAVSPAASPSASPSPGLAASPSPSPIASPTPSPVAAQPLQLDDYPFAVMIDNIAEARPHFGLAEADVVYEAPAEAGIPRLMPIYLRAGAETSRIGPVRSTRHYFVYLANEFKAALIHVGSSPQGFNALAATGLPHIDEERGTTVFQRDPRRRAPHNAFVSTASVRDTLSRQRNSPLDATSGPLNFGQFRPGPQAATSVRIDYPGPERYTVEYTYAPDSHLYTRVMDGRPHTDGDTGQQYAASSIVVEYVPVLPIPNDAAQRVDVSLLGTGKGLLIAEGTQVPLQWSRASIRDATQFARTDGAPFMLPSGQVWIQIVPVEARVDVS